MASLADQFCPNVHDCAITAAAHDPVSGVTLTADEGGTIAVQRSGEPSPHLLFRHGTAPIRAATFIKGAMSFAVGDDQGTVALYRTDDGDKQFEETREGARGRVRAMRGVALNPDGSCLAAIAIDGLLRVWDLAHHERRVWRGFSGATVEFDLRGERLLAMDDEGQPRLTDLGAVQALTLDRLATPAQFARFSRDGTMVVAAGAFGMSLLRTKDGALVASFAAKGGSGIVNLLLSIDGTEVAAITQRSVHRFALPKLDPIASTRHGAPETTGAAVWTRDGIEVGGSDGRLHTGGKGSLGPVTAVAGTGDRRLAAHGGRVGVWSENRRVAVVDSGFPLRDLQASPDGNLILTVPEDGPIAVFDARTGTRVFDGGPETSGAPEACMAGGIVAARLERGGCRWWDLEGDRAFALDWPRALAHSDDGRWLAGVTPTGTVQILDPRTGAEATPPPVPLAGVPVRFLAFSGTDLLVLDHDGVLGRYDLAESVRTGAPARGRDLLTVNVALDRVWALAGGTHCAMRLVEGETSTILFVDLEAGAVASEVKGLDRSACVDVESGHVLEPARGSAIVERDRDGNELRVLRSLAEGEWLSFGRNGILAASPAATRAI
jgi:WD40 repeat protein